MKTLNFTVLLIFIIGCTHPEESRYKRNQGLKSTTKGGELNSNKSNSLPSNNGDILKMEIENGVRYVWVEINGIRLRFIFDTGASNICISTAEATVLFRQGTIQKDDVINVEYFQDATGKISEGTIVNLKEIKIGNMVLNDVKATVIDNVNAPLLLGQTVLERFGSIEIDNFNKEIKFK
jgi:aspartyl protease family protein